MRKKLLIGLTGGIGAGKSIVSSLLRSQGYLVIKSDLIAKEIMLNDPDVRNEIIKNFGTQAYSNNELNTTYLAEKIFSSKENVDKINSIVHPKTIKKILGLVNNEFQKSNIIFVESALIYEAKIEDYFDYVILVYSDKETRLKRVIEREKIPQEKILQRMKFQIPDEKKKSWADFVIDNNNEKEDLVQKVNFILNLLKSL